MSSISRLSSVPKPFERRFQARQSSPLTRSLDAPTHSRQVSYSSQRTALSVQEDEQDQETSPWEVVRWTKLKKISSQAFSEAAQRAFGQRTCLTIGASIVIGTSKGIVLVFDYQQILKHVLGQGTQAQEAGSVMSLAISADHSTVAAGHANGAIFTWNLNRPAQPFLHIPPVQSSHLMNRSSDVHVIGHAVLHIGFLGTRNTALVSADDSGMAFSHSANRGLGPLARSVRSKRILGRYPTPSIPTQPRKVSSVLAFSPLPLGNVEQMTDDMGLTALLTPFLLVVVSATPVAQTQFKSPRSQDVSPHSLMTGCLAWFPAVKIKESNNDVSDTKLAYSWSNVLTVLDLHAQRPGDAGEQRRPTIDCKPRSRWIGDEAIVAVQWLSRSVLAVLTVTQRLVILEDSTMRVADSSDLNPKLIYHQDLFSRQLQPLVDKIEQEDPTMHGVVPDAYQMSFKAYKGRLFLLGSADVSMGILSNWADRLVSHMEAGNLVQAIELATAYYTGDSDKSTVGLPDNDQTRHSIVKDKLLEMISAALKYTLSADIDNNSGQDTRPALQELIEPIFVSCLAMYEFDFLFEEVYGAYSDASCQEIFLYALEPRIVDLKITEVPTEMLQDLVNWYAAYGLRNRLEEIICSLHTDTMDIDKVTALCRSYHLYDALAYVWNTALHDYVTPLIDMLELAPTSTKSSEDDAAASKIFAYLAYILTGRIYPYGTPMLPVTALKAQASLYAFIFSGKAMRWPSEGRLITFDDPSIDGSSYPYLRKLLIFDTSEFLSMLNEAFVDSFLSGDHDMAINGLGSYNNSEEAVGFSMNRQRIISILLDVVKSPDFEASNRVYLDIFLSRNLAKFSDILVPGPVLREILEGLCRYPDPELADECQLSVEYLLTIYQPTDTDNLIPLFTNAGFFKILKSTYKRSKQYSKWLQTHFADVGDRRAVFDCIADCLRPVNGLSTRQIREVKNIILEHSSDLAAIDVMETAKCLQEYAPDLLTGIFDRLKEQSYQQFLFLQALLARNVQLETDTGETADFKHEHEETYVNLMCRYDPRGVADYVNELPSGHLRLDKVLPAMEKSGAIDAAVALMARDGLLRDAMQRLTKHLSMLQKALVGLLQNNPEPIDLPDPDEAVTDLVDSIRKYVKVGIWLCQVPPLTTDLRSQRPATLRAISTTEDNLSTSELLWLDLITASVDISRALPPSTSQLALRALIQDLFTALLSNTTSNPNTSFLPILRAFLARTAATSPDLASLRAVLSSLFAAYAFESSLLALAHALLDKDVFAHVSAADDLRRRGWRPRRQACEECALRAWGAGAGVEIWDAWRAERAKREVRMVEGGKGKGREVESGEVVQGHGSDAVVLFACRHLWHRKCLESVLLRRGVGEGYVCPVCE